MVFHVGYDEAMRSLERWLQWARRCRIDPFVALARTITYYRADIEATLLHGVNNGRVESLNTKVRLIARRVWIPLRPGSDRPLRAHPGRSLPTPARPTVTVTGPTAMPEDPINGPQPWQK